MAARSQHDFYRSVNPVDGYTPRTLKACSQSAELFIRMVSVRRE
ncbi:MULTISPECIES: hypothetical protein [unclassified Pseudomonas]|nr:MULTISPECIES: hypothetical protein [unclassified Pseudomonas]